MNGVSISAFSKNRDRQTDRDWPEVKQSTPFLEGTLRGIQAILRQSNVKNEEAAALTTDELRPSKQLELGFKSDVAHYSTTLAPLRKRAVVSD